MRRIGVLFLCMLFIACAKQGAELLTGHGLDTETQQMAQPQNTFAPNEPFSLVLRNAHFRDNYVDLSIHHIRPDGEIAPVRTITLSNISSEYDYIQIKDRFALPYPGRYRIEFSQLTETIAFADVEILDFALEIDP